MPLLVSREQLPELSKKMNDLVSQLEGVNKEFAKESVKKNKSTVKKVESDCSQCIYSYYYDTCNASWKSARQYENAVVQHICPFYEYGHGAYLEVTSRKTPDERIYKKSEAVFEVGEKVYSPTMNINLIVTHKLPGDSEAYCCVAVISTREDQKKLPTFIIDREDLVSGWNIEKLPNYKG